jgi:hypothetical protein
VLEIREARQRLKEAGLPDEDLERVEAYANRAVEERNKTLAEELVAELPAAPNIDEGRKNELTIAITLSLNAIANRIDKNYQFDVRAPEPPPEPEAGADDDDTPSPPADELARWRYQRQIRDLAPELRTSWSPSESILELPEAPPADGENPD